MRGGHWQDDLWLTWDEVASSPQSQVTSCWKVWFVSLSLQSFTTVGLWPVASVFFSCFPASPHQMQKEMLPKAQPCDGTAC